MIAVLLRASSVWWSVTHVIGIAIAANLWRKERQGSYVWFAVSWAAMSIAGVAVNSHSTFASLVTIAMRLVASTTGLVALWTLARLARSRMVTLYTRANGDIVGRANHELDVEHDTIPPPR